MGTLIKFRTLQNVGGIGSARTVYQSANGQFIWVGRENSVALFNKDGAPLFKYPRDFALSVIGVASKNDGSAAFLCDRQDGLRRLQIEQDTEQWIATNRRFLYQTGSADYCSLAYASKSEGGLLAIGHLSPGLAVVTEDGDRLWQMHPSQKNSTDGNSWLVAIDADGSNLYAVSAMASANYLVALEPKTGTERARRYLDSATRVAGVAALSNGAGVLVAFAEKGEFGYEVGKLILYNANLSETIWERHFDDPETLITALCVDEEHPIAAIALGAMGKLQTIDVLTGRVLTDDYAVKNTVYCLHLTQGRYLAVATEAGCVDMLQYRA